MVAFKIRLHNKIQESTAINFNNRLAYCIIANMYTKGIFLSADHRKPMVFFSQNSEKAYFIDPIL